jgi:CspA family cold shock protein
MTVRTARRWVGTVVAYDEHVGLGELEVETRDGQAPVRFGFHCTQLADGSRTVAVGSRVDFCVLAGRGGRWEAADIRRADNGG